MSRRSTVFAAKGRGGFTLVELLVVIGIIALLIAVLLPALANARRSAEKATCMSNMHQLTIAYLMYAQDQKGLLLDPNTSATGWVNSGGTDSSITQGVLYPYCKNSACDHCPADSVNHNRSYSINDFLNGNANSTSPHPPYHALKISQVLHPVSTIVFVEEYDSRAAYNEGSFWLPYTGDSWIDYPAHFHGKGSNVSFADGHVEYWIYNDPRTLTINAPYALTPGSSDLKQFENGVGYWGP